MPIHQIDGTYEQPEKDNMEQLLAEDLEKANVKSELSDLSTYIQIELRDENWKYLLSNGNNETLKSKLNNTLTTQVDTLGSGTDATYNMAILQAALVNVCENCGIENMLTSYYLNIAGQGIDGHLGPNSLAAFSQVVKELKQKGYIASDYKFHGVLDDTLFYVFLSILDHGPTDKAVENKEAPVEDKKTLPSDPEIKDQGEEVTPSDPEAKEKEAGETKAQEQAKEEKVGDKEAQTDTKRETQPAEAEEKEKINKILKAIFINNSSIVSKELSITEVKHTDSRWKVTFTDGKNDNNNITSSTYIVDFPEDENQWKDVEYTGGGPFKLFTLLFSYDKENNTFTIQDKAVETPEEPNAAEAQLTKEKERVKEAYKKQLISDSVANLFATVQAGLTEQLGGRDQDSEQAELATAMNNIKDLVQKQDTPADMIAVAKTALQSFLTGVQKKKMPIAFDARGNPTSYANERKLLIFNSSKVLNRKEREAITGTLQGYLAQDLPGLEDMISETDVAKWGLDAFPSFNDLEGKLSQQRDLLDAALQEQLKVEGNLADLKAQLITQSLIYDSLYTQKVKLQEQIDAKNATSAVLKNENIAKEELKKLESQLKNINMQIQTYAGKGGGEGKPNGGLIQASKDAIEKITKDDGELDEIKLSVTNAQDAYDTVKETVQKNQDLRVDTWKVANKDVISNDEAAADGTSELTDLDTAIFHLEEELLGPERSEGEGIIADIETTQQDIIDNFYTNEYTSLAAHREKLINEKHTTEEAIRQKTYQKNVVHMREYEANRQLLTLERDKLDTQRNELDKLEKVKESKLNQQLSLLLSLDDYDQLLQIEGNVHTIDGQDIKSQKQEAVDTIAQLIQEVYGSSKNDGKVFSGSVTFEDLYINLETHTVTKDVNITLSEENGKIKANIAVDGKTVGEFEYPYSEGETSSIMSQKNSLREEQSSITKAVDHMKDKKVYMETFTQWDIVSQQLDSLIFDQNVWTEQRDALIEQRDVLDTEVKEKTFGEGDNLISKTYAEWQKIYTTFRTDHVDATTGNIINSPSSEESNMYAYAKEIKNTYGVKIDALTSTIDAANAKIDALQATIDEKTAIKESLEEGDNGLKVRYATLTNDVANKYITSEKYSTLDLPAVEKELTPEDYENLLPKIDDTDEID